MKKSALAVFLAVAVMVLPSCRKEEKPDGTAAAQATEVPTETTSTIVPIDGPAATEVPVSGTPATPTPATTTAGTAPAPVASEQPAY